MIINVTDNQEDTGTMRNHAKKKKEKKKKKNLIKRVSPKSWCWHSRVVPTLGFSWGRQSLGMRERERKWTTCMKKWGSRLKAIEDIDQDPELSRTLKSRGQCCCCKRATT